MAEHIKTRNNFIEPYASSDDECVLLFLDVFLKYLEDWKQQKLNCLGNFTAEPRAKMFLSQQTYEGSKIAACSHIEAVQFLVRFA